MSIRKISDNEGIMATAYILMAIAAKASEEEMKKIAEGIAGIDIDILLKYYNDGKSVRQHIADLIISDTQRKQ